MAGNGVAVPSAAHPFEINMTPAYWGPRSGGILSVPNQPVLALSEKNVYIMTFATV